MDLVDLYGLDDEQLMFRRLKVGTSGLDLFKQEYPCCPDEAFLTTGMPVFNPEQLVKLEKQANPPLSQYTLQNLTYQRHPRDHDSSSVSQLLRSKTTLTRTTPASGRPSL